MNFLSKMTKEKKTIFLLIISVLMVGAIIGMFFLGIFLYRRYTPNVRFAYAEQTWEKADRKKAYDDIAVDFHLGHAENTLDLLLTIEGNRVYNGNDISADYQINLLGVYEGLTPTILSLDADIDIKDDLASIKVTKKEGLMDVNDMFIELSNEQYQDIDLNLNSIMLYDTQRLSIAESGNFYIEGRKAFDNIISALSMIMKDYIDIDIWNFLDNKTNFSRVKGDVYYQGAFFVEKIKSSQNISFYMPWQELDQIVEEVSDSIPPNILEIYQNKKIEIEVPVLGNITIDLKNYMPEGMLANIRIITETRYQIL
jgi:hypothetical protein